MASLNPPFVLTANDLRTGEVVYWAGTIGWQPDLERADVIEEVDQAETRLAEVNDPSKIVGAYLAMVMLDSNALMPAHYRESFRSSGPSNYFHGKQAGN